MASEEDNSIPLILGDYNDFKSDRSSLIALTSEKIKEHINYLLAYVVAIYSLYNILTNFYFILVFLFSGIVLIYIIGRLFYWNKFNSYVMTHTPYDVKTLDFFKENYIYHPNPIWGIYTASKFHIEGSNNYERSNKGINNKIAYSFSNLNRAKNFIIIYISFIIGFLISYYKLYSYFIQS